jgi:hypothetical protein
VVATFAAAAVIYAASTVVGAAVVKACRNPAGPGYEGAVGLALLLALTALAIRLPGDATTACLVGGIAVLAAAAYLRGDLLRRPRVELVSASAVVFVAGLVPFVAGGGVGVLGVSVNNDMAAHLGWAETLRTEGIDQPLPLAPGYPIGPHALVATVAQVLGAGVDAAFVGLLIAIPLLAVPTALALMGGLTGVRQAAAGAVVAMPYLIAAYYGQSAFKETLQALFVVAFVALVREIARGERREAWALVLITAILVGCLYNYSYLGLTWPFAIAGLWLLLEAAAGKRRPRLRTAIGDLRGRLTLSRRRAALGLAATVVLGAVLLPEVSRAFTLFDVLKLSPEGSGAIGASHLGNLFGHLSPFQGLGLWPAEDFRVYFAEPREAYRAGLAGAVGAAGALAGALACVGRRDWGLLAGVGASGAMYAYLKSAESPYVTAKALVVLAPLVMAMSLHAILTPRPLAGRRLDVAAAALGVLFVLIAGYSSFLALRGSTVLPKEHPEELSSLRPLAAGKEVLALPSNEFIHWQLRGAGVTDTILQGRRPVEERKRFVLGLPLDFDWPTSRSLDRFAYVLAPRTRFRSEPPANFKLARRTRSFELWERTGPTPDRRVLSEGANPGKLLDCDTREGRAVSARTGWARVVPKPVSATASGGQGFLGGQLEGVRPGRVAQRRITLPPGRYELSVTYTAPRPPRLTTPVAAVPLPAQLERPGTVWHATELSWPGGRMDISFAPPPMRLGASQPSYLGRIVAVPIDRRLQLVPLAEACGLYVDWYTLGRDRPPLPRG